MRFFQNVAIKYHIQPALLPQTESAWLAIIEPLLFTEPHPTVVSKQGFFPTDFDGKPLLIANRAVFLRVINYKKELPKTQYLDAYKEQEQAEMTRLDRPLSVDEQLRLSEKVTLELLPSAPPSWTLTQMLVDLDNGLVMVDASSDQAVDLCLQQLRLALDTLPVKPPYCDGDAAGVTLAKSARLVEKKNESGKVNGLGWQLPLPAFFGHGDALQLRHAREKHQKNRSANIPFDDESIQRLLSGGFVVQEIGLHLEHYMEFRLTDKLTLKRVKWDLAEELEQLIPNGDDDNPTLSYQLTCLALMVQLLRYVIPALLKHCQCVDSGLWLTGFAEPESLATLIEQTKKAL